MNRLIDEQQILMLPSKMHGHNPNLHTMFIYGITFDNPHNHRRTISGHHPAFLNAFPLTQIICYIITQNIAQRGITCTLKLLKAITKIKEKIFTGHSNR